MDQISSISNFAEVMYYLLSQLFTNRKISCGETAWKYQELKCWILQIMIPTNFVSRGCLSEQSLFLSQLFAGLADLHILLPLTLRCLLHSYIPSRNLLKKVRYAYADALFLSPADICILQLDWELVKLVVVKHRQRKMMHRLEMLCNYLILYNFLL